MLASPYILGMYYYSQYKENEAENLESVFIKIELQCLCSEIQELRISFLPQWSENLNCLNERSFLEVNIAPEY